MSYMPDRGIQTRMDDKPRWREIAEALGYWTIGALVAGAMVYGLWIAIWDILALLHLHGG